MANLTSGDIGKIVSFTLYPSAIVGTQFSYAKVKAILDAESVFQWIDPISLHANVYPTLPPGTPNDYKGYLYAKLELQDGQVAVVGLPWIDESTIVTQTNTTVEVVISDVEPDAFNRIRNLLLLNGYDKLAMRFVNP